ncbi:uncharacterized protein EDC19_1946 [Natranaerovirga hydrolytica]|uniref:TPM domain-containing protein n=1 Tax=Natranaerovirga hydrolytica TaxID=680378 RepID=A0A4V6NFD0_9FIRM|nr:TPM domain-containing protein [Natranaerovirga hydrolytica]TCK92791.1 uncharacterized protein EDC19_1946 [Natranaerovirga hydrolytica]
MVIRYGIKKRVLLITVFLSVIFLFSGCESSSFPEPTNDFYVNDYVNLLDSSTKQHIVNTGRTLENLTSAQVVVVVLEGTGSSEIERYSIDLFREWGIGDETLNNGVLLLLDMENNRSRIEIGYGLEGALPDGKTGRIQDNYLIPHFREGNYSQGIRETYNELVNEVYIEYGYEDNVIHQESPNTNVINDEDEEINPIIIFIGTILLLILIILDFRFTGGWLTFSLLRSLGRGGSSGGGRSGGGGSAGGGGSSRSW